MPILVRPAAAADIDAAALWYQRQRAGLGDEFLAVLRSTLEEVAQHPFRYPVIHRDTRRALMRRFPYAIFYRVYGETVVIVACLHGRRDPRRWMVRT